MQIIIADFCCKARNFLSFFTLVFDEIVNQIVHNSSKSAYLPRERLQKMVESVGAQLWFLPPYSPDLNPIEKMWSKIKSILRTLKARTEEALINAIAKALEAVTASDAKGWFESCG